MNLSGTWNFRFDDEEVWRDIDVPGCWDALGRKDRSGPAWYGTQFVVPRAWAGRRVWLEFGAVSYDCAVFVNGNAVGAHTGAWDGFRVEITRAVEPGRAADLLVRVEKPAGLTHGPDSPALPGRFPLRETLSGFLPYVWGHMFGGLWQDVRLAATGAAVLDDVYVRAAHDGQIDVEARLSAPGDVRLELFDPSGAPLYAETRRAEGLARFETRIAAPRPWSPRDPALYRARLTLADGDERDVHFGLRSLRSLGATLLLNGEPLYPRMALSWGWYPEALHANPGPQRVRADLERLRALGYNGVKLCLWFPPQYYFDLADELGMLLWVELPMWLPHASDFFRRQTPVEYERLARLARNHPAVILYTLGCELNRAVGADVLGPLYARVRAMTGDALVRDNSGSGEAYGGLLDEFADFYDYHFYSDPQFLRHLLDMFSPRGRPELPWLFGEFCDSDTFRDLRRVYAPPRGAPWWTRDDATVNPQGARWQYDLVAQEARLRAAGLWEHGERLEAISRRQASLHRKVTLERVRGYREVSGYVVTGEADTPISTAGMWDDLGVPKFDPAQFRRSNGASVLLLAWGREREWAAGGDRAAYRDAHCYFAGTPVRASVLLSHYGSARGPARVQWSVACPGSAPHARGEHETDFAVEPGTLREVAVAQFTVPGVAAACRAVLQVRVQIAGERFENEWPLWYLPPVDWRELDGLALVDPQARLSDWREGVPGLRAGLAEARLALATQWTPEVAAYAARGGGLLLLQSRDVPGLLPCAPLPFWREAIKWIEPHPAWGDFPHEGWADLQFYGLAPDCALETAGAPEPAAALLRRLDARSMQLHDYAVELRERNIIVTTLRFDGGLGDQPSGLARNPAGAYLMYNWLRYLRSRK